MESRMERSLKEMEKLSKLFGSDIFDDQGITTLRISKQSGIGQIRCINFDKGLFAMEFELRPNMDLAVPLCISDSDTLKFIYCLEGDCYYRSHPADNLVFLNTFQNAIVRAKENCHSELLIKKGEQVKLQIIQINADVYFQGNDQNPNSVSGRLATFFKEFKKRSSLVHLGKLNLEIADFIKNMRRARYTDSLSELLYFEGICILILASHIGQYKAETYGLVNSTSLLTRELKVIIELADSITQKPDRHYSLDSLCSESGLSAAKLQEGFKFLYHRTVSDYIRNTRLERAERLLRETDMNISEVVYSVGLTSRSYFCKIFKEKYKCNPKKYKNSTNMGLVEFIH
ncbi:MAG: AraC family transcriptional regulator [Muricauda sp.]|nr:AraC family transcriptional regulator [Allomuricauda sp.]MBC31793.1 AraC family transcriptional regulator [Allomuricauda sp.]